MSREALAATRLILDKMDQREIGAWASVELHYSLVTVAANNPNLAPIECESRVLDPIRQLFPGGVERQMDSSVWKARQGRTRYRDVRDGWRYDAYLCDQGHEDYHSTSCHKLIVNFPRRHTDHRWVSMLPVYELDAADKKALRHRCMWCHKAPTAKQAADAGLPTLVWPS